MQLLKAGAGGSVYLLADHLDAVLAAGEDLVSLAPVEAASDTPSGHKGLASVLEARRTFVESARTLEVAIVARVLKAREHAAALKRADARFKLVAELFIASTHMLVDAARDLGDSTTDAFNTGHEAIAFLRSRGLIAADAAGLGDCERLVLTEEFRLAGVAPLGVLLDLVATFLDTLDLTFDLYGEVEQGTAGEAAAEAA